MTQEQKEFQQNITFKARQKGWFISFLVTKLLPFIIENWDDLFPKKTKATKVMDGGGDPITDPDPGTTPDPPQ